MTRFRSHRWAGAVCTALGLFVTTLAAQPPRPDPLEAARLQQALADQKVSAVVNSAIEDADRALKNKNAAKAAQLLRTAQTNLDLAVGISGEARKSLTATLQARLAVAEGRPAAPATPGTTLDPKTAAVKAAQKDAVLRYIAELNEVNAGIGRVRDYQAKGQSDAANAEIAKLARAYPNNPGVIALGQTGTIRTRVEDALAFQKMQSDRMYANYKGILESGLPAIKDVEYPKNWQEITKARLKPIEMTPKEKRILETLDRPLTVSFNERPLEEALQDLSNAFDLPLLLDKKSLEDLLVDLKKGVSFNVKGVSGRTVLRSVLASQGLTFIVKDETIQVVTMEKAKSTLTTRVYPLGDLINGVGPFGDFRYGPFLNLAQTQESVKVLTETITKSVDPLSWKENGGQSTVTFHAPSMSLIVRAPTEVHFALSKSFGSGR